MQHPNLPHPPPRTPTLVPEPTLGLATTYNQCKKKGKEKKRKEKKRKEKKRKEKKRKEKK